MTDENWHNWTRKQFESVPRDDRLNRQEWRSLLFFPTRKLHDSGYAYFAIIGVDEDGPKARILEYDVFNFYDDARWINIDCLYPSGVFRMFCTEGNLKYSYGRVQAIGLDRTNTH